MTHDSPVTGPQDAASYILRILQQAQRSALPLPTEIRAARRPQFAVERGAALDAASSGDEIPDVSLTYLTKADETADLPNSRQLLAGTNITLDDSTPGELTISASGGGGGIAIGDAVGSANNYRYLRTDGSAQLAQNDPFTNGRVPVAGANGILADSANLTFISQVLSILGQLAASATAAGVPTADFTNLSTADGSSAVKGTHSGATGAGAGVTGVSTSSDNDAYGGNFNRMRVLGLLDIEGVAKAPADPETGYLRLYGSSDLSLRWLDENSVVVIANWRTGTGTITEAGSGGQDTYTASFAALPSTTYSVWLTGGYSEMVDASKKTTYRIYAHLHLQESSRSTTGFTAFVTWSVYQGSTPAVAGSYTCIADLKTACGITASTPADLSTVHWEVKQRP